ncbi:MAG: hypothetical protein FWE54_06320 [Methanimicrococcus sp.]|nr:hypothetical protein [Methanimicrococcus sp.]
MKPEILIKIINITSVVIASIIFAYFLFIQHIILGIILAAGVILLGFAIIHVYRTDYLGELND